MTSCSQVPLNAAALGLTMCTPRSAACTRVVFAHPECPLNCYYEKSQLSRKQNWLLDSSVPPTLVQSSLTPFPLQLSSLLHWIPVFHSLLVKDEDPFEHANNIMSD